MSTKPAVSAHVPLAAASSAPVTAALGALRGQAAFVRALLDEIERFGSTPAIESALTEQLSEELTRLGYRSFEAAAALTHAVPVPRRGAA